MNDIPDYFNNRSHDRYCLFFKGKEVKWREAAILRQIWGRKHYEWREFSSSPMNSANWSPSQCTNNSNEQLWPLRWLSRIPNCCSVDSITSKRYCYSCYVSVAALLHTIHWQINDSFSMLKAPSDPEHCAKYSCSSCGTIDIGWKGPFERLPLLPKLTHWASFGVPPASARHPMDCSCLPSWDH